MILSEFLRTQPLRWLLAENVFIVLVIGVVDYLTGREVPLFVLYAVPILVVAWYGNRRWALGLALLSALSWWAANLNTQMYLSTFGYTLATVSRLIYFIFVAIGGRALRLEQAASQARIEFLEKNRALKRQILLAAENEQQRIGQELHDGLCQYLAAISFAAKMLGDDLRTGAASGIEAAAEIEKMVKNAMTQTRDLARGIFPVQMDEAGLPAALEDLVATTNRVSPMEISFQHRGPICIPDPKISMHLYRIAQEAMHNAMKHASATSVVIDLDSDRDRIKMTVSDDGQGFHVASVSPSASMGFRTMEYRARSIGAELRIESDEGSGSSVTCIVPSSAAIIPPAAYV